MAKPPRILRPQHGESIIQPVEDEWLRGGPVRRWLPKGLASKLIFTFETGGTGGVALVHNAVMS